VRQHRNARSRTGRPARRRSHDSASPAGAQARRTHKTLQLCRQVGRALALTLPSCADPLLAGLAVHAVVPAPDDAHLLVLVAPAAAYSPAEVHFALTRAQGLLRQEVARSITRKRAPELSFQLINPAAPLPTEGHA